MISPEDTLLEKRQSLADLGDRLAASGQDAGEFFAAQVIADNAALGAGGSPVLDTHQRAHLERIVGPNPKTPEQRAQRLQAATDAQLARSSAAGRWRAWIDDPAHVDALAALAALVSRPGALAALTAIVDTELADAEQREEAGAVI